MRFRKWCEARKPDYTNLQVGTDYVLERPEQYGIAITKWLGDAAEIVNNQFSQLTRSKTIKYKNTRWTPEEPLVNPREEPLYYNIRNLVQELKRLHGTMKFTNGDKVQFFDDSELLLKDIARAKTTLKDYRDASHSKIKLISTINLTLDQIQQSLELFRAEWGRSGTLRQKEYPEEGDPVRVFDSRFMVDEIPYLDGKIHDNGIAYDVIYPDGRKEYLEHKRINNNRLKWNRMEEMWEFR